LFYRRRTALDVLSGLVCFAQNGLIMFHENNSQDRLCAPRENRKFFTLKISHAAFLFAVLLMLAIYNMSLGQLDPPADFALGGLIANINLGYQSSLSMPACLLGLLAVGSQLPFIRIKPAPPREHTRLLTNILLSSAYILAGFFIWYVRNM
jgi:hypothetical protein